MRSYTILLLLAAFAAPCTAAPKVEDGADDIRLMREFRKDKRATPANPARGAAVEAPAHLVVNRVRGGFESVVRDLADALSQRGFAILGEFNLRTLAPRATYLDKGVSLAVCGPPVSVRDEQALSGLAMCPLVIAVYVDDRQPQQVQVSYRRLTAGVRQTDAGRRQLEAAESLLDEAVAGLSG